MYAIRSYYALSSRDQIKARLKTSISDDVADWGVVIKTVEIQDINPSPTMQKAMEEQAAAERQRRATVTRADGEKEAVILQADGRLEAAKRDAEAKRVQAQASRDAIEIVITSYSIHYTKLYDRFTLVFQTFPVFLQSDS